MGAEAGDNVVLVNPLGVVAITKQVSRGKLITIVEECRRIAGTHGVEACCSLTTGIFIMTAANAVEEAGRKGQVTGDTVLTNTENRRVSEREIPWWTGSA